MTDPMLTSDGVGNLLLIHDTNMTSVTVWAPMGSGYDRIGD